MRIHRLYLLSFLMLAGAATTTRGVVLDWDAQTWTNNADGTPKPNYYEIDSANTGTDVTITATGNNGATFTGDITAAGTPQTPTVGKIFLGGKAEIENSLVLAINLTNNTQSVTVNLNFLPQYSAGITNLTFTLFDIDKADAGAGNQYEDQLTNIKGLSADGVTWISPTITNAGAGATNTITPGGGLGQIVTGTASANDTTTNTGAGNIIISFGNNAITSFQFTYGSGASFANPTFQHVGLYDFSFTPVPEINPAWSAVISCFAAAGLILRHRATIRK